MFQGPKGYIAQICKVHLQYGNRTTKWPFYTLLSKFHFNIYSILFDCNRFGPDRFSHFDVYLIKQPRIKYKRNIGLISQHWMKTISRENIMFRDRLQALKIFVFTLYPKIYILSYIFYLCMNKFTAYIFAQCMIYLLIFLFQREYKYIFIQIYIYKSSKYNCRERWEGPCVV